ncbi:MAG: response regulator transcription factor [Tenericutes bacterium]|nr:response regulator transcription factor [Mycoplasmatota bacterium]
MDKILLVDDEIELANMIKEYLKNEGFEVLTKYTLADGKESFDNNSFSAVVLDINLPDGSGLDLCKYVRDKSDIPILMLSARSGDVDKIMGLGLGSDDYITKPFSASELSARIRAHINRYNRLSNNQNENKGIKRFKDLVIDEESYEVFYNNEKIELTAKEFQILNYLSSHPNRVYTKEQLFNHVWGFDYYGDMNTVTVHIRKIREKIEINSKKPRYIKTVWGVGYKFENPE